MSSYCAMCNNVQSLLHMYFLLSYFEFSQTHLPAKLYGARKEVRGVVAVFDWKVQRFCWPKGTPLESAESIYVKTTGAAYVSEELCRLLKEGVVSLGDSGIERVRGRLAI